MKRPATGPTDASPTTPHGGARLRHIDALRALAALLVVWLHVSETYLQLAADGRPPGAWLHDVASAVDVGRIGVVCFFLISGFVIPFSIRPQQPSALGAFVIKRVLRIYPVYWVSIPLGALTGYWLWGQPFGGHEFLLNLTLLQDFFSVRSAEGLYWTLLVELVFYALCVVLFLTNSLFDMRRICALAMGLGFVYSLTMLMRWAGTPLMDPVSAFWFLNLSVMLCGTLYRRCIIEPEAAGAPALRRAVFGLLAWYVAILPAATIWAVGFAHNVAVAYALGFLLFMGGTGVARVKTGVTDWLGRISYSIYLFHPVVFYALLWGLLQLPEGSWWRSRHLGWYLLVNIALTAALATWLYRLVEQPGIRLGQHWAAARTRRGALRLARGEKVAVGAARLDDEAESATSA